MQNTEGISLKKSWAVWLLLPTPFVIGDWILWDDYRSGALAHELVAQAMVPLAVIGSLGMLVFLFVDLLQRIRGDHLEINAVGVVDLISRWKLGTIPWNQIADLKILRNRAAKVDICLGEHSPLRRTIGNSNGVVSIYSLAMTEQQERAIRELQGQAMKSVATSNSNRGEPTLYTP